MSDFAKKNKSGWENLDEATKAEVMRFADDYMYFLNHSKTEREIITTSENIVRENGFRPIDEVNELHPGDRVYYINRHKNLYLAVIGTEPLENGVNIVGAHADSPRLDLKPNPLFQQGNLAFLKGSNSSSLILDLSCLRILSLSS